jgi:SAM-dependent methyltransferase
MNSTSNLTKYTSKNPIQKLLIHNFIRKLFMCLDNLTIKTVLDAGCGEGFILSEFKDRGIGEYLEGIDFSEEALSIGKKLFPGLKLGKGDIYNMPYENNSFDLVISTEVMEHLEKPDKALDEVIRVSSKYCMFSVPSEPMFMISNLIRGKNILRWGNDPDHLQHWSSRAFEDFIRGKSDVLAVKRPFPWTIVLSSVLT